MAADIATLGLSAPLPIQMYYGLICSFIEIGVFAECIETPKTVDELAAAIGIRERALFAKLVELLATVGVLERVDSGYRVAPQVAPTLGHPAKATWIMFDRMMSTWFDHVGEYLKTGKPLEIHRAGTMSPRQWDIYQRAMSVRSCGQRLVAMAGFDIEPRRVLDWAGGVAAVCKPILDKYPAAHARIIELPNVVALHDGVINVGPYAGRLEYIAGDVRTYEPERAHYDVVIMAAILHHLGPADARDLLRRSRDALAPGGIIVIEHGFPGEEDDSERDPLMFLTDILFQVSSGEGELTLDDFKAETDKLGLQLVEHSRGILLLKHR